MFRERVKEVVELLNLLVSIEDNVERAVDIIWDSLKSGGKVLVFGNGGSASDSSHFAAELVNRVRFERDPLPALSLSSDPSVLTSISNDRSFEYVFERQIRALGSPGDVAFGISTSGRSENVLRALRVAKSMGMFTVGLTGCGGEMAEFCDVVIQVPSRETPRIQEMHLIIYHYIAEKIEERFLDRG